MADDTSASIITLHQPPQKPAMSPAERAKAYRQRKRANLPAVPLPTSAPAQDLTPVTVRVEENPASVTFRVTPPSRRHAAPALLTVAALALAGVGITMNGWFARSLGSTEAAGWLFLAVGVAADCDALTLPSILPPGHGRRGSTPRRLLDGPSG